MYLITSLLSFVHFFVCMYIGKCVKVSIQQLDSLNKLQSQYTQGNVQFELFI